MRDIQRHTNIAVRLNTVVVGARGDDRLRILTIHDATTGRTEEIRATAIFIMVGASPKTGWLPAEVEHDGRGYIQTGDLLPGDAVRIRPGRPLESSMPGLFAVGDVRAGSMKRVASAVGEGSSAVPLVREYLAETPPGERQASVTSSAGA